MKQKESYETLRFTSFEGHRRSEYDVELIVLEDKVAYIDSYVPIKNLKYLVGLRVNTVFTYLNAVMYKQKIGRLERG